MKALVLNQPHQPLRFTNQPSPAPARGQVLVKLKAAALNRRDYWVAQGHLNRARGDLIGAIRPAGCTGGFGLGEAVSYTIR